MSCHDIINETIKQNMENGIIFITSDINFFSNYYVWYSPFNGNFKLNHPNTQIFNIFIDVEKVSHAEDLHYMWDDTTNSDLSQYPEEDGLMLHRYVKLWTNFVKYL